VTPYQLHSKQELLKQFKCTEETPVLLAERKAKASESRGRKKKSQKISQCAQMSLIQFFIYFSAVDLTPSPASTAKRGLRFWKRFSEDVQDLMRPFLASHYVLAPSAQTKFPVTPKSKDYKTWILSWAGSLIQRTKGPQEEIFQTCRGVVKDDLNTARFLLPYLVLNVLR